MHRASPAELRQKQFATEPDRVSIEAAETMLQRDSRRISDIAAACGLGSPQYFDRVFRAKQTGGLSPREHRRAAGRWPAIS